MQQWIFSPVRKKKKITKIESKNLSIFYNLLSVSNSTPNISLILTISQTCYLTLPIQKKKGRNKVLFKRERERTYRSMSFEQYFLRARVSWVFETIAQFFLAMVIFHDAILFIFKRFMSSPIPFPWKKKNADSLNSWNRRETRSATISIILCMKILV